MRQSHHRVEYVELVSPPRPWWTHMAPRRTRVGAEGLSESISEKCEQLDPDGWTLSTVQTIPRSELRSQRVDAAALLHFVRRDQIVPNYRDELAAEPNPVNEFKARAEASFATVYMTITSIIQGVALGILAQQTFAFITQMGVSNFSDWANILPYAIISLIFVITVAFDYSSLISVYCWTTRFTDVIFPFGLGAAQIGAAYFLTIPRAWWATNAVLAAIGALAFFHTSWRVQTDMGHNQRLVEYTLKTNGSSIKLCVFVVVWSSIASVFYFNGPRVWFWSFGDIFFVLGYLLAICFLLFKQDREIQPGENGPYDLLNL